jgi:hypothetical protein
MVVLRSSGRQAEFVLNDGGRVRQTFFVAVLGDDDQGVDGVPRQPGVVGEQLVDRFDAQVRGFLGVVFARQKSGTDLAKDEVFILSELGTLGVIVDAGCGHITRYALDANHHGFPIKNC